jgi:LacI family transcriptional regulator
MGACIAVASVNLATGFGGIMYAQLKKLRQPGQTIVEATTVKLEDSELARTRLLGLLAATPRPTALIGICIRPGPVVLAAFRAAGVPVVLIDEEADGASTVATDNFTGGYLAGQHLARTGRRSIAVVAGPLQLGATFVSRQRVRGAEKGLAELGLSLDAANVVEVIDYTRKDGARVMGRFLDEGRELDAVFCAAGDACAAGMLLTARERGVKVPEDLALLGYDDNPLASISDPPLTTIRQPVELMASEALRLATGDAAGLLARPQRVLVAPTLVLRRSA